MIVLEKKSKPLKTPINQLENYLQELHDLSLKAPNGYMKTEILYLFMEMCQQQNICPHCISEITTAMFDEGEETKCNCPDWYSPRGEYETYIKNIGKTEEEIR